MHERKGHFLEKISHKFTRWIGTPASIIVHTILFVGFFGLEWLGFSFDNILLFLTTLVSLEAIYLAIFIQMSVNRSFTSLNAVEADIDKIQDEVKDLGVDVEEISVDIDKIQESDELEVLKDQKTVHNLETIQAGLQRLMREIEIIKTKP